MIWRVHTRRRLLTTVAAVAVIALAGACGGTGDRGAASSSTTPRVTISGDADNPINAPVRKAISDLQRWWGQHFAPTYGTAYEPVSGGFYAVVPSSGSLPPCADSSADIAGNAFYCSTKDVVAWDVEGLLPNLKERYGEFVIPIVLAHEWGHAVQARSNFTARTVTRELQADCFAGAWAKHARDEKVFTVTDDDLDNSLAGLLSLRDSPGTAKVDSSAHGSGFDRVNSFETGYTSGVSACKAYRDDNPPVVEIPFRDAKDAASGGNAPYAQIVAGVPVDLEDYWTAAYPVLTGKKWTRLSKGVVGYDPADAPTCGGQSTTDYSLFYCVPEDYIGFDTKTVMPRIYRTNGDYAVSTLIATQYGLAVLARSGHGDDDARLNSLRADCFAGAYTASLFLGDRPQSRYHLSPGDLDKAVSALLNYRDRSQGAPSGFARVEAYRDGVLNGVKECLAAA